MNEEERVLLNLVAKVSLLPTHWSEREGGWEEGRP